MKELKLKVRHTCSTVKRAIYDLGADRELPLEKEYLKTTFALAALGDAVEATKEYLAAIQQKLAKEGS